MTTIRQTTHEWLRTRLHHKYESIQRAQEEIHDLERGIDALEALMPYTQCEECGAELMRGDLEDVEDMQGWSHRFGKKSMLCRWCDGARVMLFQVKEFNRVLAWAGDEKATKSAARLWDRIFDTI